MANNMKAKWVKIIGLCIVIVLVLVLVFLGLRNSGAISDSGSSAEFLDKQSQKKDKGEHIILFPKDEIYSFSMTDSHGILLNFQRTDDEWQYVDDLSVGVKGDRIDSILNYLSDVKYVEVLADVDGSDYGLDNESKICVINDYSGSSIIISFGNIDEETGEIYYAVNYDFSTVYVNSGKLSKVLEYEVEDLIEYKP